MAKVWQPRDEFPNDLRPEYLLKLESTRRELSHVPGAEQTYLFELFIAHLRLAQDFDDLARKNHELERKYSKLSRKDLSVSLRKLELWQDIVGFTFGVVVAMSISVLFFVEEFKPSIPANSSIPSPTLSASEQSGG